MNSQTLILIILSIAVLGLAGLIAIILKKLKVGNASDNNQNFFLLLQNQMQDLARSIDQKMADTRQLMTQTQESVHKTIQTQFSQSSRLITDVTEKLAKLDETNRQVVSFTDQVKNLERVLTNSKTRGNFGEANLEMILTNILPPGSFQMQYRFPDGTVVDAAIFIKNQILPVDAKFSLDNYRRILDESDIAKKEELEREFKTDLKKRIDETSKYIKPDDGTLDFAFMFIPAEGIYYDLLVNEVGAVKVNTRSLIDYAFKEKKVVIVSPTTFAAYLQTILQGLRAMQIEESAQDIRKNVQLLGRHISAYDEYMRKIGNNLDTTVNAYNLAYKEFGKIDKDVVKIAGGDKTIEILRIEKTKTEEL